MSRPDKPPSHRRVTRTEYRPGPHLRRLKVRPRERLLAYAQRLGYARPDAEDLIQEAYVILFIRLLDQPVPDWFGFLVGCVQKSGLGSPTRARKRSKLLARQPPIPSVNPSPEDPSIARCIVERVIDRLPPADAKLLRWRFGEDMPTPEIAKRLGIPKGTARMRLQRALARARATLGIQQVEVNVKAGTVPSGSTPM